MNQRTFGEQDDVDFVVVGSGAAGGVLAKELSTSGFNVVVLEQGPWQQTAQFSHDELEVERQFAMLNAAFESQTFRKTAADPAKSGVARGLLYRRAVGGSSVHFAANYWRFRPIDFKEYSKFGAIAGTSFADWPITYDELEPYYTKVDYEIGVSGAPGPFDAPRSRPFALGPMPNKSSGVILERAARALGLHSQVAPMAILSAEYQGRSACQGCGHCSYYGCEFGAKSSSLVTVIPKAQATGRCEVRADSTVLRVETNAKGRATGVVYADKDGHERRQRAKAVVVAANGAETTRLLLMSATPKFPHGLANSSGNVGRHIMFNGYAYTTGRFEHPLNEYKGAVASRVVLDFYDADEKRGFYGGGGIDGRFPFGPIGFAMTGLPADSPQWGSDFKRALRESYTHSTAFMSHITSLPVATNTVTIDANAKDRFGRPGLVLTYEDHPDDTKAKQWFRDRTEEMMHAAGATRVWNQAIVPTTGGVHLLGTARMGDKPRDSVVDRYHRAHDVPNLFICDGSSFVTSGRGQPTMTIQALAFRAADHIARFARANDI
jgi:choline dehydrogenase-like flavoprotein